MSEWVLPKEFLMALVNRTFQHGRRAVSIRYPLYGHELFSVDQGFVVSGATTKGKFDAAKDAATSWDPSAIHEAPTWGDFISCFAWSGAVRPPNLGDFAAWASQTLDDQRRPDRAARPLFLAVDTNVAYTRVLSRQFPLEAAKGAIQASAFQYLLSDVVRREVDEQIKHKYRGDLATLFRKPEQQAFLREIGGRNVLVARKAKLAQNEIDFLDKQLNALPLPASEFPEDKEDRDVLIATAYGGFSRERNVEVTLLTMDQNMVEHAKNARVRCFPLTVPADPALKGVRLHHALPALLHDLAVVLGVIVLDPFGTVVYGEWPGKTTADYGAERVKVVLDDRPPVSGVVAKDWQVLRQVLA